MELLFSEEGVVCYENAIRSNDLENLRNAWNEIKSEMNTNSIDRNARFIYGAPPGFSGTLYLNPKLVEFAKILLSTQNISLYMNRILLKDSSWNGEVNLHQDMPYFHGTSKKVTVFINLTDCMQENGGLRFVKGSHKYGVLQRGSIKRDIFSPMEDLSPNLNLGSVVFMDFLTWHYSLKAIIPKDRPLLQITYQSAKDGSYGGYANGVLEPTLVSGEWETNFFTRWGGITEPDS